MISVCVTLKIKFNYLRTFFYRVLLLCSRGLSRFLTLYDVCVFYLALNVDLRDFVIFSKSLIASLTFSKCFINFYESS